MRVVLREILASDYTGGTSRGTWDTKPSMLADMKDAKNNKTKTQTLSDLKVRVHGPGRCHVQHRHFRPFVSAHSPEANLD